MKRHDDRLIKRDRNAPAVMDGATPGKRTRVEMLQPTNDSAPAAAPVQRKASDGAASTSAGPRRTMQELFGGGQREATSAPSDGPGTAMPAPLQAKMSQAFGADFSAVRIHEGPSAQALGARAYTRGTEVHFAPGEYQPESQRGQELLGHELAHVVQQSSGRVSATTQRKGVGVNDDAALEREADEMGARAARGERVGGDRGRGGAGVMGASATGLQLAKQPDAHAAEDRPTMIGNATGEVVQRLQMIGENHAESDMRKDAEKQFCAIKFGQGYYEEYEYQVGTQPGDPKEMGAMRFLVGALFGASSLLDSIEDDSSGWEDADWELTTEIIESVLLDIEDTLKELAEMNAGKVRVAYRNYAQLAVGATAQLRRLRSAVRAALQHANNKQSQGFEASKEELGNAYEALTVAVQFDPASAGDQQSAVRQMCMSKIDGDRDQAMAEALYASKDVPGVWKVGEAHIAGVWSAIDKHDPGWVQTHHKITDEQIFTQFFHHWYKAADADGFAEYMERLNEYRSEDV